MSGATVVGGEHAVSGGRPVMAQREARSDQAEGLGGPDARSRGGVTLDRRLQRRPNPPVGCPANVGVVIIERPKDVVLVRVAR